jgi:TetR/AcrR family transcriptional repressor of mexJK operon
MQAATTLFLRHGYAGTTMDDIAALAGITKRTVYNNYPDKEVLFTRIVMEMIAYAERFAHGLQGEFGTVRTPAALRARLHDLGRRMALAIVTPEVIALRRLLIGEARAFPGLGRAYFDRAPGQVIAALAAGFETLARADLLRVRNKQRAAEQFAYLVVGARLDEGILIGRAPTKARLVSSAREGVETFLARYALHEAPAAA